MALIKAIWATILAAVALGACVGFIIIAATIAILIPCLFFYLFLPQSGKEALHGIVKSYARKKKKKREPVPPAVSILQSKTEVPKKKMHQQKTDFTKTLVMTPDQKTRRWE
jgi:hypothetical protein